MKNGLFVTIEGIEGSGKSTLSAGVHSMLVERGSVVLTREPGGTEVGAQIRAILLAQGNSALTPTAELLLFSADRAQHIEEKIKPALASGAIVLCDRFIHSTLAYQGYGRGLDLGLLQQLNQTATAGLNPDLVILIDLPAEKGLERVHSRAAEKNIIGAAATDRIEQQSIQFHQRVRQGFLELSKQSDVPFLVLDGTSAPAALISKAMEKISQLLNETE